MDVRLWRGPMLVCKSWMSASTDFSLYTALDLEPFFARDPFFAERFQININALIREVVVRSQGYLSLLRTRNCSDATLSFVAQRCPNLKVLSIKSSPSVTDVSIAEISSKCVKLRELDLSYCCYISSESLVEIGNKCRNLTVLKRNMKWSDHPNHYGIVPSDHPKVFCQNGDSDATAIGSYMSKLMRLEIQFSELTVKGLEVICRGCKDLVYLDLYGCTNMSNTDIDRETQKLKKLKEVKRLSFYMPED